MKKLIIFISLTFGTGFCSNAQKISLGWNGNEIVPLVQFADASKWTTGSSSGESCSITADAESVQLHWQFGTGNRAKWVVAFQTLSQPISFSDSIIFGIDVKGSSCSTARNVSIKFEDGTHQVAYTWHGLASLQRWCERLVVLKKQFEGTIDWNNIRVITFVVASDASLNDTGSDTGIVTFKNLQYANASKWERANAYEYLKDTSFLDTVRVQALKGILQRQVSTGLFYTWKEDKSSWLYGHGILLKLLTIEGEWSNGSPLNASATAAEKLAIFLINHQDAKGFWPRAWNTDDGTIRVNVEADGTIWMGDFPWIITGLVNYYTKSGDSRVIPAIQKARSFLYNLIDPDGKFYTINVTTNTKYEVTSAEAFAAAIQSVYELGDSAKATAMLNYISSLTWDDCLKYWHEGSYSKRPVLFANTWMSMLINHIGENEKAYNALSFVGKALNTKGPGKPEGFDGIGPVATWYEGTLTYICANGPSSQMLFDSIAKCRLSDGTVPAYNDNIGALVDIWAVNWSSLDATLWLYFAVAKGSPFKIYYNSPVIPEVIEDAENSQSFSIYPNPSKDIFYISCSNSVDKIKTIRIYDQMGRCIIEYNKKQMASPLRIEILKPGIYFVSVTTNTSTSTQKLLISH